MKVEPTINVDQETGEVLAPKDMHNYIKIKSIKHVKDFKITWVIQWKKTRNENYIQKRIF